MLAFLEKLIEIEKKAALIYLVFSENKNSPAELQSLWKRLAKDEEDHALVLKLACQLPHKEAFAGVKEDCPNPDETIELLDEILERARLKKGSEYTMLKDAVTLENKFRHFHATSVLQFRDPSLQTTFERLARADSEHLKDLNNYLQKYKEQHAKE